MKIKNGSNVKFKMNGRTYSRLLVCGDEHDIRMFVSPDSPVGQALLGKKQGDVFEVRTPGGITEVEIIEVRE